MEKFDELYKKRHSLSHILAQAVQQTFWPSVKLWVWPAIENGFYYDMLFEKPLSEENFKLIEEAMKKIISQDQKFWHIDCDETTARKINDFLNQPLKNELIDGFVQNGETKFSFFYNYIDPRSSSRLAENKTYFEYYQNLNNFLAQNFEGFQDKFITFIDMCQWGHVETTKDIEAWSYKLAKLAWAYRKWDENNIQLTRIYGYAFEKKSELNDYITQLEEAKKRDHRILWAKMKLFTISPLVWAGFVLLQPNWMIIKKALEDYLWELHKDKGYQRVWTPHLTKHELYEKSGHLAHYKDDLFQVQGSSSKEKFCVKPMNCPHHMQIFADNQFSYRDMPVRYFEPATVYRDEKTGQLSGLTRVRSITQDDWHLFCRISQLKDEMSTIVDIIREFFGTMGMNDYWVSLSVRGEDKENYIWTDQMWETSENALRQICETNNLNYKEIPWEAAFYGPKLDFMFKDAIGREWQLSTIQVDVNLPERFDLSFTNENGEKERPVVIHRAISWSLERFMGIMIENFAGLFPLWLAPVQILIVPVAEVFNDKCYELKNILSKKNIRVKIDDSSDSFSKKIRNWEMEKIPYIIIIWEKEISTNSVSVRNVKTKNQFEMSFEEFSNQLVEEVENRKL